jgi:hypothetical protein
MIQWLGRTVLYRLIGGRALLAITIAGFVRSLLRRRRG